MTAFFTVRRERSVELVLRLEHERTEWVARYIEWSVAGFDGEARLAIENVRIIRRRLARALRVSRFWLWLTRGAL